jgi:hypothetical protein
MYLLVVVGRWYVPLVEDKGYQRSHNIGTYISLVISWRTKRPVPAHPRPTAKAHARWAPPWFSRELSSEGKYSRFFSRASRKPPPDQNANFIHASKWSFSNCSRSLVLRESLTIETFEPSSSPLCFHHHPNNHGGGAVMEVKPTPSSNKSK